MSYNTQEMSEIRVSSRIDRTALTETLLRHSLNNCSLNLLFVVHLDNPKTLKNPCTLEPTDFQLYIPFHEADTTENKEWLSIDI